MQNRVFNISAFILILFFCLPIFSFAQNAVKSLDKKFDWNKTNVTKTIYIDVEKGADKLDINFEGEISQGELYITAYDPEGSKVAGFTLISSGTVSSNVNSETSGSNVVVETSVGSGSNSSSNSSSESNSASATGSGYSKSETTTTTVTTSTGETKVKSKSKSKNKNKDGKGYSVTSANSHSKGAKGVMRKMITEPATGRYKFILEAKNVSGSLSAQIGQD